MSKDTKKNETKNSEKIKEKTKVSKSEKKEARTFPLSAEPSGSFVLHREVDGISEQLLLVYPPQSLTTAECISLHERSDS